MQASPVDLCLALAPEADTCTAFLHTYLLSVHVKCLWTCACWNVYACCRRVVRPGISDVAVTPIVLPRDRRKHPSYLQTYRGTRSTSITREVIRCCRFPQSMLLRAGPSSGQSGETKQTCVCLCCVFVCVCVGGGVSNGTSHERMTECTGRLEARKRTARIPTRFGCISSARGLTAVLRTKKHAKSFKRTCNASSKRSTTSKSSWNGLRKSCKATKSGCRPNSATTTNQSSGG